jgi:glutamate dehydrogenase (NADP+)
MLSERNTLVVPDILANAGGVTVSYFEWVQNRAGLYWTLDQVRQRLKDVMRREFNVVYELMESKQTDMRTAAYAVGLSRIGEAIASQGTARFFAGE